jgi:hypothetical protein
MFLKQLDDVSFSASAIVDHIFSVTCGECCGGRVTSTFDDQDGHNVSLISSALGHLELFRKLRNRSRDGGFLIGSPVFVKCIAELSRLSVLLKKHLESGCNMPMTDMEQALDLFKGSLGALYATAISDSMRTKRFREAVFTRTLQRTPTARTLTARTLAMGLPGHTTPKAPRLQTSLRRELVARNVTEHFRTMSESLVIDAELVAPLVLPPQVPLVQEESQILFSKSPSPQGTVTWKGRLLEAKTPRELRNLQEAACKSAFPATACPFCNEKFSAKNNRNRHVREKCKIIRATATQVEFLGNAPLFARGQAAASTAGSSALTPSPAISSSPAERSLATPSLPVPPSPQSVSAPSVQFSNMGYAPENDIEEALAKITHWRDSRPAFTLEELRNILYQREYN